MLVVETNVVLEKIIVDIPLTIVVLDVRMNMVLVSKVFLLHQYVVKVLVNLVRMVIAALSTVTVGILTYIVVLAAKALMGIVIKSLSYFTQTQFSFILSFYVEQFYLFFMFSFIQSF